MSTNQENSPSALPTPAEVKAFTRHWQGQIDFIAQQVNPKPIGSLFTIRTADSGDVEFAAVLYGSDVGATGSTPDEMMEVLQRSFAAESPAGKAGALRKQAAELLIQAKELEGRAA